jgi:hypothetical protein
VAGDYLAFKAQWLLYVPSAVQPKKLGILHSKYKLFPKTALIGWPST